ncbi:MAG: hypothetical protein Kow0069_33420 [Promethearchaeota archaeon]
MNRRFLSIVLVLVACADAASLATAGWARAQYAQFEPAVRLRRFTCKAADGVKVAGIAAVPAEASPLSPAAVVVHGFTSFKERMLGVAVELATRGIVASVIDLRGHKGSGGRSSFGTREWLDVAAALDWMGEHLACNESNAAVVGTSMGAVTAILAGALDPRVRVVVEASGFANVSDLADPSKSQFLQAVPPFLRERLDVPLDFRPSEFVNESYPAALMVVHGTADDTVPFSHGLELYSRSVGGGSPVARREFFQSEAGHGVWHDDPGAWEAIVAFCEEELTGRASPSGPASSELTRRLTKTPDVFLYAGLPAAGLASFPLAWLAGRLVDERRRGAGDDRAGTDATGLARTTRAALLAGGVALLTGACALDRALADSGFLPSAINLIVPNLFFALGAGLAIALTLGKRVLGSCRAGAAFETGPAAWVTPAVALAHVLLVANLGALLAFAPLLLPRSTFWEFFLPLASFFSANELVSRAALERGLSGKLAGQGTSPKNHALFVAGTTATTTALWWGLAPLYVPVRIRLGLFNPELLLPVLAAVGGAVGAATYRVTRNFLSGALLVGATAAVLLSALMPAF